MSNLPAAFRGYLKEYFKLSALPVATLDQSSDGTTKLLLRLFDGREIESVIIPSDGRVTLCISSQAGCAMDCAFCATARMGLERNLTTGEIVGQVIAASRRVEAGQHLTNYVFMGMGEPLANYPRLLRALTIMTVAVGDGHLAATHHGVHGRAGADDRKADGRDRGASGGVADRDHQ